MRLGDFKYQPVRQAETNPAYNDSSFRWDGIQFHIVALLQSKTGENLPGKGTKYCKRVKQIPPEIKGDLSKAQETKAEEAAKAKELWFIKVDGEGWNWTEKNGAKPVEFIQRLLIWLQAFKDKEKAHSAKAFYIEITTNPL